MQILLKVAFHLSNADFAKSHSQANKYSGHPSQTQQTNQVHNGSNKVQVQHDYAKQHMQRLVTIRNLLIKMLTVIILIWKWT